MKKEMSSLYGQMYNVSNLYPSFMYSDTDMKNIERYLELCKKCHKAYLNSKFGKFQGGFVYLNL